MLALTVAPQEAIINLQRLRQAGAEGQYGMYEAIDYTASRVPRGKEHAVVRSFMAHHQGMSLLSLAYALLDRPMQRRFAEDPVFRSAELLLHERVPKQTSVLYPHELEAGTSRDTGARTGPALRVYKDPCRTAVIT